jgi:hypothetical protein
MKDCIQEGELPPVVLRIPKLTTQTIPPNRKTTVKFIPIVVAVVRCCEPKPDGRIKDIIKKEG